MSKKKIRVSEVLDLLAQGKKRPEIARELDITMADCRKLFQHPKLKGKKAMKPTEFVLEDDTEEGETPVVDPTVVDENEPQLSNEVDDNVSDNEIKNEEEDFPVNSYEVIERKAEEEEEEQEEVKQGSWEE